MLEMSTAYLPVNRNWQRYLQDSEDTYHDLENELTQSLKREADRACYMMTNKAYEDDPWFWDLDWSTKPLKVKKATLKKKKLANVLTEDASTTISEVIEDKNGDYDVEQAEFQRLKGKFQELFSSKEQLFKRNSFLPGYKPVDVYCFSN